MSSLQLKITGGGEMIRTATCTVAIVLGVAILMTATLEVTAGSGLKRSGSARLGARSFLAINGARPRRPFAGHRGHFRRRALFNGFVAAAPYDFYAPGTFDGGPLVVFVSPPEPPHSVTCKRSRETVKVPSEVGGVSEITITRC
jgi:hypothetical protein